MENLLYMKSMQGEMYNDGYVFYQSVNGVWLTKNVPVKYMKKYAGGTQGWI